MVITENSVVDPQNLELELPPASAILLEGLSSKEMESVPPYITEAPALPVYCSAIHNSRV